MKKLVCVLKSKEWTCILVHCGVFLWWGLLPERWHTQSMSSWSAVVRSGTIMYSKVRSIFWVSKPEWAALFALGGGVHTVMHDLSSSENAHSYVFILLNLQGIYYLFRNNLCAVGTSSLWTCGPTGRIAGIRFSSNIHLRFWIQVY